LLTFHNVVTMSKALERFAAEGHALDAELIASSSPYQTEHLNRFGRYALHRNRVPDPPTAFETSECHLAVKG
jgi:hypothetical protein